MGVVDEVKGYDGQDVTCCDGACTNDGLSFLREMFCFLLLGSNRIICKDVVEDSFLSDRLFPSGQCFLSFDDLPVKPLEVISMAFQSSKMEADPLKFDKCPHLGQY